MWLKCGKMGQEHDKLISAEIRCLTQMRRVDCQDAFGWQHGDDADSLPNERVVGREVDRDVDRDVDRETVAIYFTEAKLFLWIVSRLVT